MKRTLWQGLSHRQVDVYAHDVLSGNGVSVFRAGGASYADATGLSAISRGKLAGEGQVGRSWTFGRYA